MTRTRTSVYRLAANDPTLLWYGRAVEAMKGRQEDDPRSWVYQARIHAMQGDPPAAQSRFWKKCQHNTSYFLPWHRMYLLHFERIVAAEVVRLGGPANWALPYWNYNERRDAANDPDFRALHPAFRSPTLPGGGVNHLFVAQRRSGLNDGVPLANQWLPLQPSLSGRPDTSLTGFFGQVQANHNSLGDPGTLEEHIHNNVHVGIGGQNPPGLMSHPVTAGLDPIFWLHHCNIDRLWEVWLRRPGNRNLATPYWLSGVTFFFNDAGGNQVAMRTRDVLDLAAAALDYRYDDVSDPFPPAPSPGGFVAPQAPMPSELVGATTQPITVGKAVAHVEVPTPVSPREFATAAAPGGFVPADAKAGDLVEQVTLQLEGVRSSAPAPVFDVYVNVPDADPAAHQDRYVGRASFFGIDEASDPAGPHGGGGQNMAFDITELYQRLSETGDIAPDNLRVSFVPVDPDDNPVVVSRVNLYFE